MHRHSKLCALLYTAQPCRSNFMSGRPLQVALTLPLPFYVAGAIPRLLQSQPAAALTSNDGSYVGAMTVAVFSCARAGAGYRIKA